MGPRDRHPLIFRQNCSGHTRRDDREARNRRQRAPPDLEMDQGRSHRRRQTAGKRNRYGTGATDKSPPGKYLPSLRTRRMVRGGGKAPAERGSLRDPFCRRCHPVLPAQGGRGKGVEGFTEAVREERFNSAPGEDAADGIWALCDGECEEAGEETRNLRFPRLYAYLHTQPQGQAHSAREDGSQTVPERTEGDRRLVPTTPARPCEQTAENAECQAPRPLPGLVPIDVLPQSLAVLPESLSYLAHVAESAHARDNADVGEICRNPAPVPVVATSDHALLDGSGESRLKNPLREICTAGSVRGENQMSHGGPKRARSWKRRTEPRKAYHSWRSPLLGAGRPAAERHLARVPTCGGSSPSRYIQLERKKNTAVCRHPQTPSFWGLAGIWPLHGPYRKLRLPAAKRFNKCSIAA